MHEQHSFFIQQIKYVVLFGNQNVRSRLTNRPLQNVYGEIDISRGFFSQQPCFRMENQAIIHSMTRRSRMPMIICISLTIETPPAGVAKSSLNTAVQLQTGIS